ncbi:MAG: hypothetical protein R2729_28080 [Bryobacteraceae bacterium]
MRLPTLLLTVLLAGILLLAQAKPITKQGLIEALNIGGLTHAELVKFVTQRGVDFRMSAADETDLRKAGATNPLIDAVKVSYRGAMAAPPAKPKPRATKPAPAPPPEPPPAKAPEPPPAAEPAPPPAAPVRTPVSPKAAAPAAPTPAPTPTPSTARPAAKATKPSVDSLAQVKRIYIDEMPERLDQYIQAEIHKQLAGRLEVVLKPELADAIMTGVSDQKTGTGAAITGRYLGLHDNATGAVSIVDRNRVKILWSEEAGDRSLLLGPFRRGGPRKVADRLVGKLKKVL